MIEAKNIIAGEELMAGKCVEIFSPAHSDVLVGTMPLSDAIEVESVVDAAGTALLGWKRLGSVARGNVLFQAALLLEQHVEELAQLAASEMGKPIGEARGEAQRAVAILRYYAGEGFRAVGQVIPASNPSTLQYTMREPLGVVGIITPWNFPLAIPMWKMAPALVCGNTVVLKPAEQSSLTAYRMVSLMASVFPAGVVNLVLGRGVDVGEVLVRHPRIRGISFTGSVAVGQHIAQVAVSRGIKYQLEMGGKNPVIVAEDADLEKALDYTVSGAMRSAGQKCTATSRVIVLPGIYEEFRKALVERTRSLQVGDPLDDHTYLGPVVSKVQQEKVRHYIEAGIAEGGRLLTGGNLDIGLPGYFVAPTVFDEVVSTATIAQEEIFGPVVSLIPAADIDEAIQIANGVQYGLSASVFTRSLSIAMEFIERVEVGMVRVNEETAGVELQAPFGGMKESSSHSREQGTAAVDFYTETKTVAIRAM